MRGRKPKPLELRVLHGVAAERARAEHPQPRRVLPRCPEHLDGEARECWKRLAGDLYDAGLLTAIDRNALASYCTAYARWRKAEEMVAKSGEVLIGAKTYETDVEGNKVQTGGGNVYQNPWLAVANRALEQMSKLAAEFGMTPSSRSRVKAEISAARMAQRHQPRREVAPESGEDPRRALES